MHSHCPNISNSMPRFPCFLISLIRSHLTPSLTLDLKFDVLHYGMFGRGHHEDVVSFGVFLSKSDLIHNIDGRNSLHPAIAFRWPRGPGVGRCRSCGTMSPQQRAKSGTASYHSSNTTFESSPDCDLCGFGGYSECDDANDAHQNCDCP